MSIQLLPVSGLTCAGCAAKVQRRLREHPEITTVEVTLTPPQALVETALPVSALNEWLAPVGGYRLSTPAPVAPPSPAPLPEKSLRTYRPLLLVLAYLLAVTWAAQPHWPAIDFHTAMRYFMGGFFLVFSFFKLLDPRGFADAYRGYDLVAKAWPSWGFIYPWVEVALGLAYLASLAPVATNVATVLVMGVSLLGVVKAVLSRQSIRCACLGTGFNLPMSTVTIIEDGLMVAMAAVMLLA